MPEPFDTSLPWARRPVRNLSQERADHARLHPLVAPNPQPGVVQHYSVITSDYEPNRPMAPDPSGIIAKKGLRPPGANDIREPDLADKIIVYTIVTCIVLIAIIAVVTLTKLG